MVHIHACSQNTHTYEMKWIILKNIREPSRIFWFFIFIFFFFFFFNLYSWDHSSWLLNSNRGNWRRMAYSVMALGRATPTRVSGVERGICFHFEASMSCDRLELSTPQSQPEHCCVCLNVAREEFETLIFPQLFTAYSVSSHCLNLSLALSLSWKLIPPYWHVSSC